MSYELPLGILKRSTVHRVLAARGLSKRPKGKAATDDLNRFEAAWPNDLAVEVDDDFDERTLHRLVTIYGPSTCVATFARWLVVSAR